MSKRSGSKANKRNQQKYTTTPRREVGKSQDSNSQLKSSDGYSLLKYMEQILHDDISTKDEQENRLQRQVSKANSLQSKKDISTDLEDVINVPTCERTTKDSEKLPLSVMQGSENFPEDFSDSPMGEARDLLPSVTYRLLVTSLVQEAQQAIHDTTSSTTFKVGEALLSYLHDKDPNKRSMKNKEWKALLKECMKEELLSIFKHLIAIGAQWYVSTTIDIAFHPGLEFLLTSEDSVDGLALLLQDEVQQSRDQPASFFSSTELGSLLSINTVIHRDEERKCPSVERFLLNALKLVGNSPSSKDARRIRSSVSKVVEALTTALGNMLKSNSDSNRQSVLAWMAAVINANYLCRFELQQYRSRDAYLVTFSVVLLRTFSAKLFPQNLPKSIDFSQYCCSEHGLSLEGEISLTGKTITFAGGKRRSTLTDSEVMKELTFCCQRVVGICLVRLLHLSLQENSLSTGDCPETSDHFKFQESLHEKTLWDDDLHRMVAQMYGEQCKLLLKQLGQLDGQGTTGTEEMSRIPVFFVEDMLRWICHLNKAKNSLDSTLLSVSDWTDIVNFCARLLECSIFLPEILFSVLLLIENLRNFSCSTNPRKMIMKVLSGKITSFLPYFLRIYINTEDIATELNGRFDIMFFVKDLASRNKAKFQRILHNPCQATLVKEFLGSCLRTLGRLVSKSVNIINPPPNMVSKKPFEFEWIQEHHRVLYLLAYDQQVFSDPAVSFQGRDTIICMVNTLCRLAEVNSNLQSSRWLKELKILVGHGLQTLLDTIKMGPSTLAASFGPLQDNSRLALLENDSVFRDKCFTKLVAFFHEVKTWRLQNQEQNKLPANVWVNDCLRTPLNEDAVLEAYQSRLQQAILSTAHLQHAHSHEQLFKDTELKPETRATLQAELQRWKRTFPSGPSAAVFLVHDEERMDVMQCAMSGPVGTPYSRGLFVFDIFCPADYPSAPPKVNLVSTGDGTIFFGSRVENNEVSLASLQKKFAHRNSWGWSITKVLYLLKNMMLTAMKEIKEDGTKCTVETPSPLSRVWIQTVRHGMMEPLKNPPAGLEKVVDLYFAVQEKALLKQCARWVYENPYYAELKYNVADLCWQLKSLGGTVLGNSSVPDARLLC